MPSFVTPVVSPGGGGSVALADLNHDGRADVIVISGKSSVLIYQGKGDGTFQKPTTLSTPGGQTLEWVSAQDIDGDGNLDIVANTYGKTKQFYAVDGWITGWKTEQNVWLGKGNGTFGTRHATDLGYLWGGQVVNATQTEADFNHDGILDIGWAAGGVSLGNADGTYQPVQIFATGPSPSSVAAGDINGDGWADLVVVNSWSAQPTLWVLLNDRSW